MIQKEKIILTTNNNKSMLLEHESKKLEARKFMTFKELKEKLLFSYDEKTIYEVMKKESVSYGIAKIYLENLYFLDGNSPKIEKLKSIYEDLSTKGLLVKQSLFSSFLKRQKILIYGTGVLSKEEKKLLEGYSYEWIRIPSYSDRTHPIYEMNTLEEEIYFLARSIKQLLAQGISASKIKIMNINDEYRMSIEKIFSWYHIPINIGMAKSIYGTHYMKEFLKAVNYKEGINSIRKCIHTEQDEEVFDKILEVVNQYSELPVDDISRSMLEERLKQVTISPKKFMDVIEEGDMETVYDEDYHIFIVGFNQGVLPIIHKEEDYLSDNEKIMTGRSTSTEMNAFEKEKLHAFLNHTKNVILSYKKKSITETYYPSSFLEELNLEKRKIESSYQDSHFVNKFLLAKMLDNHYKYHVNHKDLEALYANYSDIPYRNYSNKYQTIRPQKIRQAMNQKLLLSYSSMDIYYRCSFRYYLEKVLKLNHFENTFLIEIGNLFHYVLSKAFVENFEFEFEWNSYLEENKVGNTKKEQFFLQKLKEELRFIIEEIKRQYRYSTFHEAFYEEKIYTHPTDEENITFMGIIDKLLYKKEDNLVSVIDYKTGNPELSLEYLPYGIEMQLPVYLYLIYHFSKIQNPKIVGFYLQKILNNEITRQKNSTYEKEKRKHLYLQGYSTSEESLLKEFDSSYEASEMIRGLRKSSKGFYKYSKVLSNDEMDDIVTMVDKKIEEAIHNIWNGEFAINPKRIGFDKIGCQYCPYQDICYHTEKDVVNLKEYENLEFLGGEEYAKVD